MDSSILLDALKISGIGIVVLLLVLALLAVLVWLMTVFIVDKPEKVSKPEEETQPVAAEKTEVKTEAKAELQKVAAIALALARAQMETAAIESPEIGGEFNAWRQFNLQRRLTQSQNIRRSR
jgi:sodium pump decarboxylase gamma subunit